MGLPAARMNDPVTAIDTHIVLVPSPGGPVPTPLPHPFNGKLLQGLASSVMIGGLPAAVQGSVAQNIPPHLPMPPGTAFQIPPRNTGDVMLGSMSVMIEGKPAARQGDTVLTCNDPAPMPVGTIIAGCPTVMVGG